jgi:hypothetical protein
MEYVNDHGTFADVPAARIQREFRAYYPNTFTAGEEAEKETFG